MILNDSIGLKGLLATKKYPFTFESNQWNSKICETQ